jgi:hypothetical protein
MANSFAAIADDSNSILFNPAGLARSRGPSMSFTHFSSFANTNYEYIDFVKPVGKWAYGGSLLYDSTGNFDWIDSAGSDRGAVENYDFVATAAAAYPVLSWLSGGVCMKYFQSCIYTFTKYGAAFDAGILARVKDKEPEIDLGCVLQNIGWQSAYITKPEALPINLKTGIGFKFKALNFCRISADIDVNKKVLLDEYADIGAGVEFNFFESMFLRAGYGFKHEGNTVSLGAGAVLLKLFEISYAFVPLEDLGAVHRMSIDVFF